MKPVIEKDRNGFRFIKMTKEQVNEHWGTKGICDLCGDLPSEGVIAPVTGSKYICTSCHEKMIEVHDGKSPSVEETMFEEDVIERIFPAMQ